MKKFLKKRWRGIPVGVLAMLLLAGVVAAATFTFWSGTAEVTVLEPMSVTETSISAGSYDHGTNVWTLSMYAGETQTLIAVVTNHGSGSLTVGAGATTNHGDLTATWDYPTAVIDGGQSGTFTLSVHADGDATPWGGYTVEVNFSRS